MHNIDKWMDVIHLVWIASVYTINSSMLWCILRLYLILKFDEYHPAMGVVLVCFDPFLGFHSMKAHSHPQPRPRASAHDLSFMIFRGSVCE
jgi:hypothetical protein